MMINWRESYTTYLRLVSVDTATWSDRQTITGVNSAKVTRTADGKLLEAGTVELVSGDFVPGYYRLVCTAVNTSGESERVDIATLYMGAGARTYDFGAATLTVDGRSVLFPASVKLFVGGEYAPANADGARWVADALAECVAAPVSLEASFVLDGNIVFPFGSSVLDAAWTVLNAGGCVMQITGDGTIHIRNAPTVPTLELSTVNARLIVPGIKADYALIDVPNQYIAVDEFNAAIATNDNPASPVSTVSRGFAYMRLDTSPAPVDGETLERYAERRLAEVSTVSDKRTYTREYWPGVLPYDIVRGSIPSVGLAGDMRVITQTVNCGDGLTVSEKAAMEVNLWRI